MPGGSAPIAAFAQTVTVPANTTQTVVFDAAQFPQLIIAAPALWWPWQLGEAQLHALSVNVSSHGSGVALDGTTASFGIRTANASLDGNGNLLFRINGVPTLIRGGGWAPDLLLRGNSSAGGGDAYVAAEIGYVRDMGLNAIRLEGKMDADSPLFAGLDAAGIMALPGWACCDAWQHWSDWTAAQHAISVASMRSQARRLRIHPSVIGFFISSDELPPAEVETAYRAALAAEQWPNAVIAAASAGTSPVSGPTGVKMSGPYSWVPETYWLTDPGLLGGAFGFLTEGGPGENPLPHESLEAIVPPSWLWPPYPNDAWGHGANPQGLFGQIARFLAPLAARYGDSQSLPELLAKSQAAVYEGHRAYFEGYSLRKYVNATGLIQWMLNSAWPSNVWRLYDPMLNPSASYFAVKAACAEPLHITYSYADASVWAVHNLGGAAANATRAGGFVSQVEVLLVNGSVLLNTTFAVGSSIAADGVAAAGVAPTQGAMAQLLGPGAAYLLRLSLWDGNATASRVLQSRNIYTLSTTPDVLNWSASNFYTTPCSSYADLTGLSALPPLQPPLVVSWANLSASLVAVNVTNASPAIAFMIRVRLVRQGGAVAAPFRSAAAITLADVVPIIWSANYVTLLPGESASLLADTALASLMGISAAGAVPVVETWNDAVGAASTVAAAVAGAPVGM